MNEENLNDLKNTLKYLGFGDKLHADLEHHISQGFPEFILKMKSQFGRSTLESTLYFTRAKESKLYLLKHYDAALKNDIGVVRQTFYLNNANGVTLKEAFNLLEGRAAYKELTSEGTEKYHAWIQLDFRKRDENGNYAVTQFSREHGYDLEGVLSNFPIKELSDPHQRERLMHSLEKGNLQTVTMITGERERKFSIHALPESRSINIYDYGALRPLTNEQKAELMIPQARQKLNGKEVAIAGEQQGKEIKQQTKGSPEKNTHNTNLITNKDNVMNEKNFEYLKDNLKYLGFGEKLGEDLHSNLMEGKDSFQLKFVTEVNRKPFEAVLNFRKSESTDLYFLNSYQASLERTNGKRVGQTFYLDNGKGVTAKEAYNLLEGRAVYKELENKEGEKYKAWLQLDYSTKDKRGNYEMKQFHEHYGYDLKAAVSKFAVAELNDPEKEKTLMQSLQKGNLQAVSIEKDGMVHKMFLEANPQYKVVNLYDASIKRVQKEDMARYQPVSSSETMKKEQTTLSSDERAAKKNQSQKQDSLMPKKKEQKNKGLRIS